MASPAKFKVDDQVPGGRTVKLIYGQSNAVIVFRNEEGGLSHFIDLDSHTTTTSTALREFDEIHTLIFPMYRKKEWPNLQDDLGRCLYNALTSETEAGAIAAFVPTRKRILRRAQAIYATAALVTTIVAVVLALIVRDAVVAEEFRLYCNCAAFAALGAFTSVWQRVGKVAVDPGEEPNMLAGQGAARIIIGITGSLFFVLAAEANLFAGLVTASPAALLTYSFICGFSERFAADLAGDLRKTVSSPSQTDKLTKSST